MGDKAPNKESKKSKKATTAKREKKREERLARQSAVAGFSGNSKKVLNHKKDHGKHTKNKRKNTGK